MARHEYPRDHDGSCTSNFSLRRLFTTCSLRDDEPFVSRQEYMSFFKEEKQHHGQEKL